MKNKYIFSTLIFGIIALTTNAQNVGINTTGATPNASAMLDVDATDRGLLIPRVALTATNVSGPITSPATSLLVYNTATAGTAPNNVTPGYYYWDGSRWVRVLNSNDNDWTRENTVAVPAIKTDNQYVTGNVGIGDFSATAITHRLHVIETGNSGSIHGIYVNESNQGQAIVIDESGEGAGLLINANSDGSAIYSTVNGAVTNNAVGFFLYDNRTSSTPSITKIGADIQSIGAWSGSGSSNTGINLVASGGSTNVGINVAVSGGTTNYAGLFNGGNVGIGTLIPHTMIHVHDPSSALNFEIARFTNGTTGSGTGDGTAFGFSNNGQNFYMDNKEGAGFQWWTSGTERMRLTAAGILTFNNNNTTAYPPYLTNGAGAFSWNFSAGQGEVTLWNNTSTGTPRGFTFRQMTSATTHVDLMRLQDNGAIFGKFRHITHHSYNNNSYRGPNLTAETNWFPSPGGDGSDDCWCNVNTTDVFRRNWVAPYNGRLVKVSVRIMNDSGSNPDVQAVIRLNVNGTDFTDTNVISLDNAGVQTIFLPTTGFSFNAGDRIALGLHKRGNNSDRVEDLDILITAVWEYDIQN